MFKIITLFCIILLSSILVVAQPERTIEVSMPIVPAMRELHHDYINNNQKLILNTSDEQPALTKRETTILGLIARGDSYGEVAELLSVSVGTVQSHIKNIYGKLAVHSRGEAVFEAHRRGLLSGVLGDKPKQ